MKNNKRTIKKIKKYKDQINPQSPFALGCASLYAKIMCLNIADLDEKLKNINYYKVIYAGMPKSEKEKTLEKIMRYI